MTRRELCWVLSLVSVHLISCGPEAAVITPISAAGDPRSDTAPEPAPQPPQNSNGGAGVDPNAADSDRHVAPGEKDADAQDGNAPTPSGGWSWRGASANTTTCAAVFSLVDGGAYAVGSFFDRIDVGAATPHRLSSGPQAAGIFLTRSDANGQTIWGRRVRSDGRLEATAAAQDMAGNIYVAGQLTGTAFFGDGERFATKLRTPSSAAAGFIAKFEAYTGSLVWVSFVAEDRRSIRIDDVAVTPYGMAVVSGDYARLGREAFLEGFDGKGRAVRRMVFDSPGFRGPIYLSAGADYFVIAGGMGSQVDLPNQRKFDHFEGSEEQGAFVAWYSPAEFALEHVQLIGAADVVAVKQGPDGSTAFVRVAHEHDSHGRVLLLNAAHTEIWSESITLLADQPVRLDFNGDGDLFVGRSLGPVDAGQLRRAECHVRPVRGDGDAAVSFLRRDLSRFYTFTAGGSGLTNLGGLSVGSEGTLVACGQYTETAAFWQGAEDAAVFYAGDKAEAFVSRIQLPRL